MRLKEENPELNGIVSSYNLRGFSFREFLNLKAGTHFKAHRMDDILKNHVEIAREILSQVNPLQYFQDYVHHGFYPFFLEKRNFSENLLKTMNMMMEVDILLIKQIDLKYLAKVKKLFYLMAVSGTSAPNVSQLAKETDTRHDGSPADIAGRLVHGDSVLLPAWHGVPGTPQGSGKPEQD